MELKAKLIQLLPEQSGVGKNGEWRKQEAIFETQEQYPKKVCITFMKDNIQKIQSFAIGDILTVHINIESREYNGKWYTGVSGWKIEGQASAPAQPLNAPVPEDAFDPETGLPF
jgi:hypothetical protein